MRFEGLEVVRSGFPLTWTGNAEPEQLNGPFTAFRSNDISIRGLTGLGPFDVSTRAVSWLLSSKRLAHSDDRPRVLLS